MSDMTEDELTTQRHINDNGMRRAAGGVEYLAKLIGRLATEAGQREALLEDLIVASAEGAATKRTDVPDGAKIGGYNAALWACYGAGYTSDELAPHFMPV